jgi:hypothetical protein
MKMTVNVAVAPLRKEPSDRSEMISQALFGEGLIVLDQNEKWAMVRMELDGYEGWIDRKQMSEQISDNRGQIIKQAFASCKLHDGSVITLPAGAWMDDSIAQDNIMNKPWAGSAQDIEDCAKQFLNAPYLWGGRTLMGIDCSGFTQLVMRLNGVELPRDAYQQAECGETVSFLEETKTGDLAFFDNADGRIIHVGIVLKDQHDRNTIIHASGKVRIDMIDHQGIYNRDTGSYSHQLRIVKRV